MKDPFMAHLGFAVLHLAPGEAVVGEAHLNLHGTAHGGFLSRHTATYEVEAVAGGQKVALFIGTVFRLGGEAT